MDKFEQVERAIREYTKRTRARAQQIVDEAPHALLCQRCARQYTISANDCRRFLDRGWPKCHDETMMLVAAPSTVRKRRRGRR